MTKLAKAAAEYVALRRALGFKMVEVSHRLADFVEFAQRERASHVTVALAVRWAKLPAQVQAATRATRLRIVRQFTEYLSTIDPRTEIPPRDLLPGKYQRKTPYLYDDDEIQRLLQAARRMRSPTRLRAWTYETMLGLLSVTGMRLSEMLALDRRDVDLREGVLTIRQTKCRKLRLLPVHETTRAALLRYASVRDRIHPIPKTEAFLLSEAGFRLNQFSVREIFVRLSRAIDIRTHNGRFGHGPRLHDFRHRLGVNTLVRWYRSGANVEHHLPILSTYLGHTKVTDTYWYLQAIPELLRLALTRVEHGGAR